MIDLLVLLLLKLFKLGLLLALLIQASEEEEEVHRYIDSHERVEDRANVFSELLIFNPVPDLTVLVFVLKPANRRVEER